MGGRYAAAASNILTTDLPKRHGSGALLAAMAGALNNAPKDVRELQRKGVLPVIEAWIDALVASGSIRMRCNPRPTSACCKGASFSLPVVRKMVADGADMAGFVKRRNRARVHTFLVEGHRPGLACWRLFCRSEFQCRRLFSLPATASAKRCRCIEALAENSCNFSQALQLAQTLLAERWPPARALWSAANPYSLNIHSKAKIWLP